MLGNDSCWLTLNSVSIRSIETWFDIRSTTLYTLVGLCLEEDYMRVAYVGWVLIPEPQLSSLGPNLLPFL